MQGKVPGSWPKVTTRPDVALQDGDLVGSLTVIACPGHSPGHVAFLDTRDRSLIAGDVSHQLAAFRSQITSISASLWPRRRPGTRQRTLNPLRSSRALRRACSSSVTAPSCLTHSCDGRLRATGKRSHSASRSRGVTGDQGNGICSRIVSRRARSTGAVELRTVLLRQRATPRLATCAC
jgi:hypothetical protein